MGIYQVFFLLQLLDLLTTLVGFQMGAGEASPFIRLLMHASPVVGVATSKVLALVLGALCVHMNKLHLIRLATYWFCGLVAWNLLVIMAARGLIAG